MYKHFPGHGNTATDSHVSLPIVDKAKEELYSLDLIPFQKAIEENKVDYLKFKLTGTIYDNRQDNIKYFSKDQIEKMEIEPYNGMTNKQIIESYEDRIWECAYQLLDPEWKFKKTKHDSENSNKCSF